MYIKIQGGGTGVHANAGSSAGIVTYLQHEDAQRVTEGQQMEHFFNHDREEISPQEVTYKLDHNRAQLHKTDAKFFVISVNPSRQELSFLGATPEEQAEGLKKYIREDLIQQYAENFGKELNAQDIEYYAKIHHSRNLEGENEMHAHIIVSRKDKSNRLKLSPKTNHRKTSKGAVKGGFDRENFFKRCEQTFDKRTGLLRDYKESYQFKNVMRKGTPEQMREEMQTATRVNMWKAQQNDLTRQKIKHQGKEAVKKIKGRSL